MNSYHLSTRLAEPRNAQRGQALLLIIVVLSAMFLSITVIAGLLTFYQLRQAIDVKNSVIAIYAAESGLELEFYRWFKDRDDCHGAPLPSGPPGAALWPPPQYPVDPQNCYPEVMLGNGSTYSAGVRYGPFPLVPSEITLRSVRSTGQSGSSARTLQADL